METALGGVSEVKSRGAAPRKYSKFEILEIEIFTARIVNFYGTYPR